MTPEKKPFFAATYLPRIPRMGMPGIIQILERVAGLWHTERQRLEQDAAAIIKALDRHLVPQPGQLPGPELLQDAFLQLAEMYDELWGGFGNAPKFPMPVYLSFLLRFWKRTGTADALSMVEHSLRMLRQGGVYDQLGFGCHRYAVDRQWLVPHFEKMLYDQALIASAFLETFQATDNPWYRQVAEEIFDYVLEEMTSQEGGFFAGQDADTEGEEGICYLWTPDEIVAVIGPEEARLFCGLFGVTKSGNFEGRNILHLPATLEEYADREGLLPSLLAADIERWRRMLLTARRKRIRPFRDEKVITAWNGLMIAALARGYALSGKKRFLEAGQRSADFIGTRLATPGGRLLRSFHLGKASMPGFLEDYAFFIWGLIELHQATLKEEFLDQARTLASEMLRLFAGVTGKGLYETGHDSEQLPVRQQSIRDGVLPSGNSMAVFALFRLGRITGDNSFLEAGEAIAESFMGDITRQPLTALNLISAADYHLGPEMTVTLTGERGELEEMLLAVHRRFLPNLAIRYGGGCTDSSVAGTLPTASVCAEGACWPPVTGAAALGSLLDELRGGVS
jgi:uncharacterized protein YyaL (SSP411 family)